MAGVGRKLLKVAVWVIGGLVVLVGAIAIVVVVMSNRELAQPVTVPVPVADIRIPDGDPEAIARGQYLVDHVLGCKTCHAQDLAGRAEVDDPMIGTLWGPNLTSGGGSVSRTFTPADWVRAIRHGVAPDGHRLVLMPSEDFTSFSDEDLGTIVAYIKSMPPVDRPNRGIRVGPLGRVLLVTHQVGFAFDKIDHAAPRPHVSPSASVEWGKVLAGACRGCHGDGLSGGKIPGADPAWPPARNLTPDETGLKGWTVETFSNAFRHGQRPDGTTLTDVMPWKAFSGMTDTDVTALFSYLQTLPSRPFGGR
jgi:mono/diheme cytochrome c family protein